MKKCTDINELLSAYSDNELTASDKLSVEEHLAACENCSALLEIYQEISISAEDLNVPVPDALRIGVMNRVRSEGISAEPIKETKKKKWWQHQVLLTRIAPIAACMAVVLLVWQFGGNRFGIRDNFAPEAAQPPYAMQPAGDSAMSPPAPEAVDREFNSAMSLDDGIWDEDEADWMLAEDADDDGHIDSPLSNPQPFPTQVPGGRIDNDAGEALTPRRLSSIIDLAYAEITITGDFPEFLTDYDPLPIENWNGWDMIYEIPQSEVESLMKELINRPGTSLVRNHNNSPYAIVFYSKG